MSAGADQVEGLVVVKGIPVQASLVTTPKPLHPGSVGALLARSRFDAVCDALDRGDAAYLNGVPFVEDDVRASDVALFGALAACAEGTRHVRKIEDTGLDTHRGAAPGIDFPVLAIVGLALLTLGALLWLSDCGDAGPHPEDKLECLGAAFLMVLGFILILLGYGKKNPFPDPGSSTGTPLIHGVLKDFAGSTA